MERCHGKTGANSTGDGEMDSHKEKEVPFLSHPNLPIGWPPLSNPPGYLDGALHDERRELRHHQVHTLKAGLFQFEDLLFDNRLKGQVRGEEPRSENGQGWWGRSGGVLVVAAETEGQAEIRKKEAKEESQEGKRERKKKVEKDVFLKLVGSTQEKNWTKGQAAGFHILFLTSQFLYNELE